MSQDQEDQTFNKKAREYWDSLSEEEKKDFSQRVLEPTFKIVGDSLGRLTKELNKIAKAMKPLGEYLDAHRETVARLEEWPKITGLSNEQLNELTIPEAVELVEKCLKEGPQPRPKISVGGSTVTVRVDTVRSVIKQAEAAKEIAEQIEAVNKLYELYSTIPSSPVTNVTKKALNNPARVGAARRGQIKQTAHYLSGDSTIIYKGKDSTFTVTLERTKELFTRKIQNGVKVFNFLLEKLNEQHMAEVITFTPNELIGKGIYKNKDSAVRGLNNVLSKMYAISIGNRHRIRRGERINKTFAKSRLISGYKVDYTKGEVAITPIIRNNARAITILPSWAYSLNDNAYLLLDYFYFMARQRYKEIKRQGHFTISLEAIRAHLGLPTLKEAGRYPQQLIQKPIEKAIEEIEDKRAGADIKITPVYNYDHKDTAEYLQGYLKIELDETAQAYMEDRAISQQQEYKKQINRSETAQKAAAIKALKAGSEAAASKED